MVKRAPSESDRYTSLRLEFSCAHILQTFIELANYLHSGSNYLSTIFLVLCVTTI